MNLDAKIGCKGKIEKKITINFTFYKKKRWITEIFIDFHKTCHMTETLLYQLPRAIARSTLGCGPLAWAWELNSAYRACDRAQWLRTGDAPQSQHRELLNNSRSVLSTPRLAGASHAIRPQ